MSNEITTPVQAVAVQPKREVRVVEDNSPIAYLLDTAKFEHCYRIAGAMARASLIPKHLKGDNFEQTQANCFLVVNQAMRWQFDPFSVAPETYEIGGKLGFSGKLIAAVINARAGLESNLSYKFNDLKGDALEVTVFGWFKGESDPRTVTLSVAQGKTPNQMWTRDPHQKLVYSAAIKWARRHKPEVIMGVMTEDDGEAMAAAGWENAAGKKFQIEKQEPALSVVTLAHAPIKAIAATVVDDNPELAPEPPKAAPVRSAVKTEPKTAKPAPAPVAPAAAPQSPALAAMLADDATASVPESEPEPAAEQWTVQTELKNFCVGQNFGLGIFLKWALNAKWLTAQEVEDATSWDRIPQTIAVRCLRSKTGLVKGLTDTANGGGL